MARPLKLICGEQLEQIEKLAPVLDREQLADFFDVSVRTLRRRFVDSPEVLVAYKRGKARAIAGVANSLVKQALGGNVQAMIFYLRTQAGWREPDPRQLDISDVARMSDKQLEKEKRRLGLDS